MGLPYADPTNTGQWAADELYSLGAPINPFDVSYLEAWQTHESPSGFGYNPLGDETGATGSIHAPGNTASVQAYTSWLQGLQTTTYNLTSLPQNAKIVAALRSGNATYAELSAAQAQGGWGGGGEKTIAAPGTSTPFNYGGPWGLKQGATGVAGNGTITPGKAPNPTGLFGQTLHVTDGIGNALDPFGNNPFGFSTVQKAKSSIVSGVFGPLTKWITAGAADVTFIGFGLLLVVIGLAITFKGEGEEAAPVAAAAVA